MNVTENPKRTFGPSHCKEKGRAGARRAGSGIAERVLAPAWVRAVPLHTSS